MGNGKSPLGGRLDGAVQLEGSPIIVGDLWFVPEAVFSLSPMLDAGRGLHSSALLAADNRLNHQDSPGQFGK